MILLSMYFRTNACLIPNKLYDTPILKKVHDFLHIKYFYFFVCEKSCTLSDIYV